MTKISVIQSVLLPYEANGMNLVSYLAQEGENEAVYKLIDLGGRFEDAAYGYAIAGNQTQLSALLEKCPQSQHDSCMAKIISGFARAGRFDAINDTKDYRKYRGDLVYGIAQSGDYSRVTSWLDREINWFAKAVEGYASCNHRVLLTKLIEGTVFYPLAIEHAARSGHTELVNSLLAQRGVSQDYKFTGGATISDINAYALLNSALKGYVLGRHFNDAVRLLERGANIAQCLLDLKDASGVANHELYLAILAHINDTKLRENVLKKMATHAMVMESLEITPGDRETLEKIIGCMHKSNLSYVEARNQLENAAEKAVEGEISLSFLAGIVQSKLNEIGCQSAHNQLN